MAWIPPITPGFRTIAGELINLISEQVNNLTGNGTAGPVTGSTGAFATLTATSRTNQAGTLVQTPTIIAAAGATQGNATAITTGFVIVTVTASTQGVKLPAASTGLTVRVSIGGTKGVKVYPAAADKISTAATNVAVLLVADKTNLYVAKDQTTWLVQKGA